jgi:perosamine synthetase
MSATTIAVLHAGGVPVFVDVDPDTWLMYGYSARALEVPHAVPVSLYGLWVEPTHWSAVDDAAQTLRRHHPDTKFTSYSFQASKILPLGEGGMLVTDSEELATRARCFSSLGYSMKPDQPRIDPQTLKHPTFARHHELGWNYRMSDHVARLGTDMMALETLASRVMHRRINAAYYREAIKGCSWITPQHVPAGWAHDYWTYAVALEDAKLWEPFTDAIVRYGGEMPYGAWRLTYQEPAFRHLAEDGCCPVAESLQPRLVQFQTNRDAMLNADAVHAAIREVNG